MTDNVAMLIKQGYTVEELRESCKRQAKEILALAQKAVVFYSSERNVEALFLLRLDEAYSLIGKSKENKEKPVPQKTFVYLMVDEHTGYYKIGISKNPKYRESTLQAEVPKISMLYTYVGTKDDEKALHKKFAQKRLRGEWFRLDGLDIVSFHKHFKEA